MVFFSGKKAVALIDAALLRIVALVTFGVITLMNCRDTFRCR